MTDAGTVGRAGDRLAGVGLVSLAMLAWSFSGVFTRLLTTDVLTAVAWRSFFGGVSLAACHVAVHRARAWTVLGPVGWAGAALVAAQAVCQICTVGSLYFAPVADVTLIYATAPFMAAGLAWGWLGERPQRRTVAAGIACLGGTLIIVAGSLGGRHGIGDLLALGMTLSFACVIVIPRARPDVATVPATVLGALVTFAIFAPASSPAALDLRNWSVLGGFGLTNFTVAMGLFVLGARRIPAAQAGLIAALDLLLAPAWVWLAFGERPGAAALLGGGVNAAAVAWHTLADLRDR